MTVPVEEEQRARLNWVQRRHAKMAAEIARNRQGGHKVPTWVMAVALIVVVGAWLGLIFLSG